jgi:hypothetical protein
MKIWMSMVVAVFMLAAAGAAAQTPAQMPPAGDAEAGKTLYVRLGCWTCHGYEGQRAPRRESPRDRFPPRRSRDTFGDRRSGCRTIRRESCQTRNSGTFTRIYSRVPCRRRSRAYVCSSRRHVSYRLGRTQEAA